MQIVLTNIFLQMWVMGFMAVVSIAIICIAIIILDKVRIPSYITIVMWVVVAIRMLCPVSYSSVISPYNLPYLHSKLENVQYLGDKYPGMDDLKVYVEGTPEYEKALAEGAKPRETDVGFAVFMENDGITPAKTTREAGWPIVTTIWISGIVLIWLYAIISYLIIKNKVKTAVIIRDNVFVSDNIKTPFVIGFIKPQIYLPLGLDGEQQEFIICHEQIHISRHDHQIKPFAFLLCSLYWYNPFLWVAIRAFIEQIEISCDELVIKRIGSNKKINYCQALLDYAIRLFGISPVAFGEVGTKIRIKKVMDYNNPSKVKMAFSIVVCIIVCIFSLSNPIV